MIKLVSFSTTNADFLFRTDENGQADRAVDWSAGAHSGLTILAHVANEALGFERNEPKDYAWRFYDVCDVMGMQAFNESKGVADDQVICAIATIGDREIVFTCDC